MAASESEKRTVNRKERMQLEKVEQEYRPVEERVRDFEETTPGFTAEEAMAEAGRCIHCPQPAACVVACPLGNDVERALWCVEEGDFLAAARIYRETNPWPEICGRVCPDEASCATKCVLTKRDKGINTQAIEAFVADYQREHEGVALPEKAPPTGRRVGIVGAGPAGLAAAEDLAVAGHEVVVYDAWPAPGGLLVYGIPNFKLAKGRVQWKTDWLRDLGVKFVLSTRIGEAITLDDLIEREGYDAIFLGTGAGVEARMEIPGEDLGRVHGSMQYLVQPGNVPTDLLPEEKRAPIRVGKRVAVIGGGDTATDCLRTAVRQGAEEVVCYYRRTEAEMPGNANERHHAEEEGARILYLTAPVEMLDRDGDGNVDAMRMIRMELGEPDASGRRRPVPIEGSEYEVEVDDVILAIGFWPDPLLGKTTPDLKTRKWGLLVVDQETGQTSRPEIFAGGDDVTGPSLVNAALAAGRRAAKAMNEYLASNARVA
ncbi:MAG: NAD(P)-dependent oxidoreductase [Planctomycetota bacterium]